MPDLTWDERDEQDEPEKPVGREGEHGEMLFDNKTPIILSDAPWRPPKKPSKDVIEVNLDETWSEMRTEAMGRRVFYYRVWNATKGHEYSTELFEGVRGEPVARCNCPSGVVCKHVKEALKDLLDREPTFGECESTSEFMLGIRGEI